jgi:hypothetical protein
VISARRSTLACGQTKAAFEGKSGEKGKKKEKKKEEDLLNL